MNEGMLTGESTPMIKSSLPDIPYYTFNPKDCAKYILSGGTVVKKTMAVGSTPCIALVTKTGFLTLKGSLVRDILYPKEFKFVFYTDSLKFLGIMAGIALAGTFYTIPTLM